MGGLLEPIGQNSIYISNSDSESIPSKTRHIFDGTHQNFVFTFSNFPYIVCANSLVYSSSGSTVLQVSAFSVCIGNMWALLHRHFLGVPSTSSLSLLPQTHQTSLQNEAVHDVHRRIGLDRRSHGQWNRGAPSTELCVCVWCSDWDAGCG
jgi:hypothetical protein